MVDGGFQRILRIPLNGQGWPWLVTALAALAVTLSSTAHLSVSPFHWAGKLLGLCRQGKRRAKGTVSCFFPQCRVSLEHSCFFTLNTITTYLYLSPLLIHYRTLFPSPPSHHGNIRVILFSQLTFPSRIVYFWEETFDKAQSNFKYMICHVNTCHLSYALQSDLPAILLTFRGTLKQAICSRPVKTLHLNCFSSFPQIFHNYK